MCAEVHIDMHIHTSKLMQNEISICIYIHAYAYKNKNCTLHFFCVYIDTNNSNIHKYNN